MMYNYLEQKNIELWKGSIPVNVAELIEGSIKGGSGCKSLLKKTYNHYDRIYEALKNAYAKYLELSIKVKNL